MIDLFVFISILILLLYVVWRLRRKKLASYDSDISGLIEAWEKYDGEKVLTINKYPHGISTTKKSISKSYWHFIARKTLNFVCDTKNPHVLFFGLGANTSSGIISRVNPHIRQTIIEIDDCIIQACKEFFGLEEMLNTNVIKGDAYKMVDRRKDFINKFDVIVVDIFTGIPPYVSTKTNQPPFIEKVLKWCKKDGMIIFNRPANIEKDRQDTRQLAAYLKTKFNEVESVYIKDPRGYQNDIVTARFVRVS